MTKKKPLLEEYISAEEAAKILSEKMGREISARNMYQLAHRKKNPIRTQVVGNRFVYNRSDTENTTIKEKQQVESSGRKQHESN